MLPCHSCYIYGTWKNRNVEGLKSSYGGKNCKPHRGSIFMGAHPIIKIPGKFSSQLVHLNYLPISVSFGVKIIMHYITFLLIKTSQALGSLGKIKV